MNILITGGTGFIGSVLVTKLLKKGHKIHLLIRDKKIFLHIKKKNIFFYKGDITDYADVLNCTKDIDVVYHLAGIVNQWNNPEKIFKVNITGTKNILRACKANNVPLLIYISSVVALGNKILNGSEDLPLSRLGHNPYSNSKILAEAEIRKWIRTNKLKIINIRPGFVLGKGDPTSILTSSLKFLNNKIIFIIGDGNQKISFIHVDDLVQALLSCIGNSKAIGNSYNLVNNEAVTINQLISYVEKFENMKLHVYHLPLWLAYIVAAIFELLYALLFIKKEPLLSLAKVSFIGYDSSFSNKRAVRDLAFHQSITIKKAVYDFLKWCHNNQHKKE